MKITEADVEFREQSHPDYLGQSWPAPDWLVSPPIKIRVTLLASNLAEVRAINDFLRRSVEVQVVPVDDVPVAVVPPPVQMSRCSFCAKPTDWQCPNCMIDKGMRYPLCSESTGSDCQLRHRAFHKCHLPR